LDDVPDFPITIDVYSTSSNLPAQITNSTIVKHASLGRTNHAEEGNKHSIAIKLFAQNVQKSFSVSVSKEGNEREAPQ
jgi:hypothetical protein